jgi:hypothetical protein
MELAVIINVHSDQDVVVDTIESIQTYGTNNILAIQDGASPHMSLPVSTMRGLPHGCAKSPYRNVALGLATLVESFPNCNWYCYLEYDCLFTSTRFLKNLEMADEHGVWMLGNDGHVDEIRMPLIQSMLEKEIKQSYYLLGACQFFSRKFMTCLTNHNFFERFLSLTNAFSDGYFPLYNGYDISEHLYPTLARHFGGNIGVFATYDYNKKQWHGSHRVFPIRWRPELDPETEDFPEASIIHPLKSFDHPIRARHRRIRQNAFCTL